MALLSLLMLAATAYRADTINVFAAASLKDSFTEIARRFEATHLGTQVRLNFGGSQLLAAQINQGAPADVFASADERNLRRVQFDPASYRVFAENRLIIVVRNSYRGIRSLAEIATAQRIVVADPAVPVGAYTEDFLSKAGALYGSAWLRQFRSHVVSKEQDVRAVLAKVQLGEADAGVVYVSDSRSASGKVGIIEIPDKLNVVATYPVATVNRAANPNGATDFGKFLFTPEAQKALEDRGLISPLRPVSAIDLWMDDAGDWLKLPLDPKLPKLTVTVVAHDGKPETVAGCPVSILIARVQTRLKSVNKTATFIGADAYRQTLSIADIKSHKALLVRRPDGNYQLIVPGMSPKFWVHWVRHIYLRP